MTQPDNAAIVQGAYATFKSGDIPGLLAQLDPSIDWKLPDIPNVRISGRHERREGVERFFQMLAEDQEALSFEPREFIANGDTVVAIGQYQWRVHSTGKQFGGDFAHVFTIRNGQITHFREFMDTAAAAESYRA